MNLTWFPVSSIFPEVKAWGTAPLPEGGGYIITHNTAISRNAKPWGASHSGEGYGERDWIGWFASRPAAEAACRRHRQGRVQ